MNCSQANPTSTAPVGPFTKQDAAQEIKDLVQIQGLSWLEAVTWWMEERSIPETQFNRYIPEDIIEYLKEEVIEDEILKPSLTKQNKGSTLDFLYG